MCIGLRCRVFIYCYSERGTFTLLVAALCVCLSWTRILQSKPSPVVSGSVAGFGTCFWRVTKLHEGAEGCSSGGQAQPVELWLGACGGVVS